MITKPPVSPAHKPSESSEQPIVDATLARIRTKVSELLSHSATQGGIDEAMTPEKKQEELKKREEELLGLYSNFNDNYKSLNKNLDIYNANQSIRSELKSFYQFLGSSINDLFDNIADFNRHKEEGSSLFKSIEEIVQDAIMCIESRYLSTIKNLEHSLDRLGDGVNPKRSIIFATEKMKNSTVVFIQTLFSHQSKQ